MAMMRLLWSCSGSRRDETEYKYLALGRHSSYHFLPEIHQTNTSLKTEAIFVTIVEMADLV
jgi:hypothetical protein